MEPEGAEAEVFDFLDLYLRDLERGEPRPLASYLRRWPAHEERVAREYLALQRRGDLAPAAAGQDRDARAVGPYRLVRELGRGGQGAVWLAEDTRIARTVALKVLPQSWSLLSADRRRRMKREAEIVSRLAHPAICPIFEAQVEGEVPYIAMRRVEGDTLATLLRRAREGAPAGPLPLPPADARSVRALLRYFERAARALHAAHQEGVLHRDIKPGNLMVTRDAAPVILDFGQARAAGGAEITLSGEMFGTPAYMPPEQVRGEPLDFRSDVWSLGATLYEALTLARPFEGRGVTDLLFAIVSEPLRDPREANPAVSAELAVVVATALEKDPRRRYASALELAEDLRRICDFEPIRARPASLGLRLLRWTQRHPALAAVLAALALSLAWSQVLLAREARALDYALGRHLGERALALLDQDPGAALALGIEAVERAGHYQTRGALLAALDACWLETLLDGDPARRFLDLHLAADGRSAAAGLDDGSARLFELPSGRERLRLRPGGAEVVAARLSADGARLAALAADGAAAVFDARDGRVLCRFAAPGSRGQALDLDAAGERVLVVGDAGRAAVHDARSGARLAQLREEAEPFDFALLARDGSRVLGGARWRHGAPAAAARAAVLWDAGTGALLQRLPAGGALRWVDLSRDGARALTLAEDGALQVWECASGRPVGPPLEHPGGAWCAAFAPDGGAVAVACAEREGARACVWWLPEQRRVELAGHRDDAVVHVAFDDAGERVVTSSHDMTVRTWDARSGAPRTVYRSLFRPVRALWSADGTRVATLSNGGTAHVWYAQQRPDVLELAGHGAALTSACFSPDGGRALTASRDGSARLWCTAADGGAAPGALLAELQGHGAVVRGAAFSADGSLALTFSADGTVCAWDGRDGSARGAPFDCGEPVARAVLARDGRRALAVTDGGRALVLELAGPRAPRPLAVRGVAVCGAFLPDGERVAVGCAEGTLQLFSAAGGEPLAEQRWSAAGGASAGTVDLDVSAAGELAVACADGRVRFARFDGERSPREPLSTFPPAQVRYAPDGSGVLVIGTGGSGAFRVHDFARDLTVRPEAFHRGNLTAGAFSADGALYATASEDGTVYVRDATDGRPVAHLVGDGGAVRAVAFGPGPLGQRVIAAFDDGKARVWPVDPLPYARARKPRNLHAWERAREQRLAQPLTYR